MTATIAPASPIRPQPPRDRAQVALSLLRRYPAFILASSAHCAGVTAKGLRDLFARCDEIGLDMPPEAEEATLRWLAEIRAAAS